MKISFITPADNLSGGTRVIATYARTLATLGHQVQVISNAPERRRPRDLLAALRRRSLAQPTAGPGHLALSGVPWRALERPRPIVASDLPDADVVVATWWETAAWMHALPASKGHKTHLIQGYEVWVPGQDAENVHAALRLPNTKLAVSAALAREIQEAIGPLSMTVIPNAIDPALFNAPPRDMQTCPTVGYVYSRAPMKGADLCLAACEQLQRELPSLQVLCFGEELPSSDCPIPMGARFVQRPTQTQLAELYAACDVWLFASRRDSFGLPILEAMACRTPVVSVPVGAAPELLSDGGGILVPPESADALALAAGALLRAPEAWSSYSRRAHERAHAHRWQDAARVFLDTINAARRP